MAELTATRTEEREGYQLLYTDETHAAITNNGLDWLAVTPDSCSCPLFGKKGSCKHLGLVFPGAKTAPEPRPRATAPPVPPRSPLPRARLPRRATRGTNSSTLRALADLFYALEDLLDPPPRQSDNHTDS